MDTPTTAAAVANAFLDIQESDTSVFPPIDQMKLQKLVYYAHAWWLALKGHALFDEDVEAWPWGPVVRDIYTEFRDCGRAPIRRRRASELVKTGPGPLDYRLQQPAPPPPDVLEFLRSVWDAHKSMTGVQLSNATHLHGEPWTIVKESYGELSAKPKIPNELIRDVFMGKLNLAPR